MIPFLALVTAYYRVLIVRQPTIAINQIDLNPVYSSSWPTLLQYREG